MGGGFWGGLAPTHLDTPGQEPSQKVTLTRASQSPCRRTVLLTRTWQESGWRKGSRVGVSEDLLLGAGFWGPSRSQRGGVGRWP